MDASFLTRTLFPDFDRRLDGDGPVGVAVSGGGDSVALLYALKAWGGRPLEVFCVDHGLNPMSGEWTAGVERHAAAVGAGFTALSWTGDKPKTGISAAARSARHRLLAEAARAKDIRVLCLGHTRDDIAEAALMRAEGSTVGAPQAWGPSPAWPEGRGVFLYRPFLNIRRAALRDFLRGQDIAWIDDPANDNPASPRARARCNLPDNLPDMVEPPALLDRTLAQALIDPQGLSYGMIRFRTEVFAALPPDRRHRLLALAAVCAGGGDRLPRRDALERVAARGEGASTLCGARIQWFMDHIDILREPGDILRHGDGTMEITAGNETVWDGRFAIHSLSPGEITPASGRQARLDDHDRTALSALPAALRASQPVLKTDGAFTLATNATLRQSPYNRAVAACLVGRRFFAAAGLYACESDLALPPDGAWL